jgi:hypothetical protein
MATLLCIISVTQKGKWRPREIQCQPHLDLTANRDGIRIRAEATENNLILLPSPHSGRSYLGAALFPRGQLEILADTLTVTTGMDSCH